MGLVFGGARPRDGRHAAARATASAPSTVSKVEQKRSRAVECLQWPPVSEIDLDLLLLLALDPISEDPPMMEESSSSSARLAASHWV